MANELTTAANPGPADALVSALATMGALLMLGSRFSLRNAPWVVNLGEDMIGDLTGLGDGGNVNLFLASLDGIDAMTSITETTYTMSNSAVTTAQATVAPADFYLKRELTDKSRRRDPSGVFNVPRLALDGVASAGMALTNALAQELDGLTVVGTSGVAFTHDTFLLGQTALKQALVPGPYACLLKPKQFTDWTNDLESRGGMTQWQAANAQMQALRGEGFEGTYNNIDVMTSDKVQMDGGSTNYMGAMWGRGCVGYLEENLGSKPQSQFVVLEVAGRGGVVIRVAESRNEQGRLTAVITHYAVGTVVIESGRGRTLRSAV